MIWREVAPDGVADAGETVIARYEYDALNRRTKEFINADTDDDFDSFRHFYYTFGWQLLETRLSDSENTGPETLQPEYQYVWSVRYLDAAVLRDENKDSDDDCIDGQDERLYFANDANMNVTALMESDGDVVERYVYDPYGNCTVYDDDWSDTVSWANSKKNNIRFCGYFFDNETGLYSVRRRTYHPPLGRWLSWDPIGYDTIARLVFEELLARGGAIHAVGLSEVPIVYNGGGIEANLYEYVSSRPPVNRDPFGLSDCCGPEIGKQLRATIADVEEKFSRMGFVQKIMHCLGMHGAGKWEITPLGAGGGTILPHEGVCATGRCENTVAVDGRCYEAAQVNYIFWGKINRLCKFPLSGTLALAQGWKIYGWATGKTGPAGDKYNPLNTAALEWTVAGYFGRYWTPSSLGHCQVGCRCTMAEDQPLDWEWSDEPNILLGVGLGIRGRAAGSIAGSSIDALRGAMDAFEKLGELME